VNRLNATGVKRDSTSLVKCQLFTISVYAVNISWRYFLVNCDLHRILICVPQTTSVWITVRKVSMWMRRAGNVSLVTAPVVPAEGHSMTTVTPARRNSP